MTKHHLSEDQIHHFRTEGFVVVLSLFSPLRASSQFAAQSFEPLASHIDLRIPRVRFAAAVLWADDRSDRTDDASSSRKAGTVRPLRQPRPADPASERQLCIVVRAAAAHEGTSRREDPGMMGKQNLGSRIKRSEPPRQGTGSCQMLAPSRQVPTQSTRSRLRTS